MSSNFVSNIHPGGRTNFSRLILSLILYCRPDYDYETRTGVQHLHTGSKNLPEVLLVLFVIYWWNFSSPSFLTLLVMFALLNLIEILQLFMQSNRNEFFVTVSLMWSNKEPNTFWRGMVIPNLG